jgi:hypothetical protein
LKMLDKIGLPSNLHTMCLDTLNHCFLFCHDKCSFKYPLDFDMGCRRKDTNVIEGGRGWSTAELPRSAGIRSNVIWLPVEVIILSS